MEDLAKNKKRAQRRKRNLHAKALKEDKQFRPKRIENKKDRHKDDWKRLIQYMEDQSEELQ